MRTSLLAAVILAAASLPALAQKPDAAGGSVITTTPGKGTVANVARESLGAEGKVVAS